QSHVVPNPPENITDAFDLIIDWIDLLQQQVNSNQVTLPTFDNRFSCLSTTGMNDLLYDTVVAIRDAVCSRPEYDIDNTAWTSCITNPAPGTGANLQITIDTILA